MFLKKNIFFLPLLVIFGCDSGLDDVDGGSSVDPSCAEAATRSDLEFVQDEIFTKSCANASACHQGDARFAAGLNLEEGLALGNLYLVPSTLVERLGQDLSLVTPGDPENSYLQLIIDNSRPELILPSAGVMPFRQEPLCDEKLGAVSRWIESLPTTTACSDGIDNDGDGLIDFDSDPAAGDPGCSSLADDDEADPA